VHRPLLTRRALLAGTAAALGCGHPKATGFRGYCFVANEAGRSVTAVDLTRFRVRKQIALDAAPSLVVAHPTQAKALALAPETGTIYELDAAKLEITRRAQAGRSAIGMEFSPSNDVLWTAYRDPASLVGIPLASMKAERRVRLPFAPDTLDIGPAGLAAAGSAERREIALVSLASGAIERTIATGDEPSMIAFRKDGRHLFLASRPERVLRIVEVASGRTVVRLPLPVEPRHWTMKPDGGQLFLSGPGMDAVVVVYVYETEIAETLLAGRAPGTLAAIDAPAYLMAANPETNSVTILDLENDGRLVASVQVGQSPGTIVLTPEMPGQDRYALVLNEQSGDLAVIRMKSLPQDAEQRRRPAPLFTLIPVGERPVSAAVMSFA
jgi:DNA-binding beta-propeller fold protein YncE